MSAFLLKESVSPWVYSSYFAGQGPTEEKFAPLTPHFNSNMKAKSYCMLYMQAFFFLRDLLSDYFKWEVNRENKDIAMCSQKGEGKN